MPRNALERDAERELAHKEGIFCGISSGGTFAAARKVAEKAPKGSADGLLTLARVIARHAVAVERLAARSGARQRAIPIG